MTTRGRSRLVWILPCRRVNADANVAFTIKARFLKNQWAAAMEGRIGAFILKAPTITFHRPMLELENRRSRFI